jgi:hypothetical protein
LEIPTPEHFMKNVDEYEEKYEIMDCVYVQCIKEFSRLKLSEINELHKTRIIETFLFEWGKMQRTLGHVGIEAVYKKIKEKRFADKMEPLRNKSLKSVKLEELKSLIVDLFDKIAGILFISESKSKKEKRKHVGSTAASKVLHLCCPDLFLMWDADIRNGYEKWEGDGKDYFQFLKDMQKLWNTLNETIEEMQRKYGKRATRITDEYNWIEFHRE